MTELTADQDVVRRYLCDQAPGSRVVSARLTETASTGCTPKDAASGRRTVPRNVLGSESFNQLPEV